MIHVLIERQIAEGMLSTYNQLLKTALQRTFVAHGFISGESFHDMNNPNHRYLWCKWRSLQDWQRWYHSKERGELLNAMTPILAQDEQITIMENG